MTDSHVSYEECYAIWIFFRSLLLTPQSASPANRELYSSPVFLNRRTAKGSPGIDN